MTNDQRKHPDDQADPVARLVKSLRLASGFTRTLHMIIKIASELTKGEWDELARLLDLNPPSDRTIVLTCRWIQLMFESDETSPLKNPYKNSSSDC